MTDIFIVFSRMETIEAVVVEDVKPVVCPDVVVQEFIPLMQ